MADAATRRELISKAWDEAEKEPDDKEEIASSEPEKEEVVEKEEPETADTEVSGKSSDKGGEEPYAQEKKNADARERTGDKPEPTRQEVTDRPPGSWKPTAREQWAKLPAEIRAEVNRRELDIQRTLSQTDNVRKFASDFAQTIQPYSHLIRQQNSTPLKAVENLMNTSARLMTGNQEQKAQVVAEIIGNYGIDLRTLDNVLSAIAKDGKVPSPNQQVEQPPSWARPMFDFMNTVQQSKQQMEARAQQEATQEIEKFAEKPFFDDLREDMADLMEVAAKRGRTMTMDDAYARAVAANPEISAIIAQRKKAGNPVSEAAATLARARRAASTVNGSPSGKKVDGSKGKPASRREAIEQAWDDAENGL